MYNNLVYDANITSENIYRSTLEFCVSRYSNDEIITKMHDIRYGNELLKYINDKNIEDIQLTKKECIAMDTNLNTAEYACRRRPTHEEIELARRRVADPNILTGKDALYAFYKMRGMNVEYDEIFAD